MIDSNKISEQALENAANDRARVEEACDTLREMIGSMGENPGNIIFENAFSTLAKLTDCLTRSNAQIVEVAKLAAKKGSVPEDELSDDDKENMFTAIEGGI